MGNLVCIRKLSLFADLDEEELQRVARLAEKRHYQKDQTIFWQGDSAHRIYIVNTGLVKMVKLSETGKEFILGFAKADQVLGEDAVFGDEAYSFSAIAMDECCVTVCSKEDLEKLFLTNPSIAMKVIYSLSRKLHQSTEQINSLAFQTARERLVSTLRQMAKEHGVPTERGLAIQVPLTHQDIASIINVSRPTVTNLLLQLRHEGVLEIVNHRMVLPNKDQAAS
ncbi:MAG: Crp/Fnr family transcriptional regulator [Firmicutes bacterium]|nr:Crp/Fnr family transcriptional regulator [Bacillota bacterium]